MTKIKKRTAKHQTGLYIDHDVYAAVKKLAEKEGITINNCMTQLIKMGLEEVKA